MHKKKTNARVYPPLSRSLPGGTTRIGWDTGPTILSIYTQPNY